MSDPVPAEEGLILLSGGVTVATAEAFWPSTLAAVRTCSREAFIDMEQVTAFDTAGLQMLLMLRRLAIASGIAFGVWRPSPVVREALQFSGLGDLIAPEFQSGEPAA